jgi:hypothetical protein
MLVPRPLPGLVFAGTRWRLGLLCRGGLSGEPVPTVLLKRELGQRSRVNSGGSKPLLGAEVDEDRNRSSADAAYLLDLDRDSCVPTSFVHTFESVHVIEHRLVHLEDLAYNMLTLAWPIHEPGYLSVADDVERIPLDRTEDTRDAATGIDAEVGVAFFERAVDKDAVHVA